MFTIATSIFDIYCLAMAAPGSTHYGYFLISYEFVYVGNKHGKSNRKNVRFICCKTIFMFNSSQRYDHFRPVLAARWICGFLHKRIARYCITKGNYKVTSNYFLLKTVCFPLQEYEHKIVPWLWSFAVFTIVRLLAFLFFSILNDLIFFYNWMMVVVWTLLLIVCAYSWLVIYSLYLELSDLTKLEDLAHLRVILEGCYICCNDLIFFYFHFQMGTMASIHGSVNQSIAGSRPTTPYTTVSTIH